MFGNEGPNQKKQRLADQKNNRNCRNNKMGQSVMELLDVTDDEVMNKWTKIQQN